MIAWAGLGVAMGTSPPEVKAVAGYVSSTPEEGGVADVIERFVLGGGQVPVKASG
jgi:hydroxymethylpyrimidine pyrophosphatase-like HAD family hydrolase